MIAHLRRKYLIEVFDGDERTTALKNLALTASFAHLAIRVHRESQAHRGAHGTFGLSERLR